LSNQGHDVHLGFVEKRVVDIVLICLFLLDVMAEALRAKIDRKSAISLQRHQFDPNVEGVAPTSHVRADS